MIAASAALVAGCSVLANFSGLEGDADGGAATDASSNDAAHVDGGASSPPSDAQNSSDAISATDAIAEAAAGSSFTCANAPSTVVLCDSFDESTTLNSDIWQGAGSNGPGNFSISSAASLSPPNSAMSFVNAHDDSNYNYEGPASDGIPTGSPGYKFEISFNVTVDLAATGSNGSAEIFEIDTDNGGELDFDFTTTDCFLVAHTHDDGGSTTHEIDFRIPPPVNDGWHSVEIDVSFVTSGAVVVYLDGKKMGSAGALTLVTAAATQMFFDVGGATYAKVGNTTFYSDNVRVTALPAAVAP